ncbi:hypothetical protein [Shinella pollutisoli]|uniref:hypothetical protein n=1 Tax=Shinella pollutisoli TaxID=2250594 RepID=UPI00214856DD|nr:hypothetical protein [Shinella pollutisoli]
MRSPGGILICTDVTGAAREADTFTCAHCNAVVIVKPMTDPAEMGGRCRMCDGLICKRCAARGVCDPFEEKLKRIEASYHARRSYAA